jgi:integrase
MTWEKVNDLRRQVAEGEQQSKVAAEFGISRGLCCQIVNEQVWNPNLYKIGTKGDEMGRRLYAAFDLGLRHGEIVKIQLKHVDFKPIEVNVDDQVRQVLVIALPPSVTKDGKATGETEYVYAGTDRLKQELEKRRFALKRNAEAYVFGTEPGKPVKNFKRMWRELFELAGLTFGRKLGRTWPSAPSSSHAHRKHGRSGRHAAAGASQGQQNNSRLHARSPLSSAGGRRQVQPVS